MTKDRPASQDGQYKCEACGASFRTEAELKEHNRKIHPQPQGTPKEQSSPTRR
jgi:hypothetical protein